MLLSPLAWGRGLKLSYASSVIYSRLSPLAWGRGLKLDSPAGAFHAARRPSRGGVD